MNYQEIKRASIVMAIGYIFLTAYAFIDLNDIKGLEATTNFVLFTFYVGFALLPVGAFIASREQKFFKACFISFLCLDFVIFVFMMLGKIGGIVNPKSSSIKLAQTILVACMNAGLALANGLYTNGCKEVFAKKKNRKMFIYSMVMEYAVTGLILLDTIISFLDFGEGQKGILVSSITNIVLLFIIYGSYAVYTFIVAYSVNQYSKPKQTN